MPKNKKSGNIREAGVHGQCDGWPADARSGGEVSSYSSTSESTTLQRSLFVICLLSQFSIPRVRTDFQADMFDLPEDLTLEEIDLLTVKILPQWMRLNSLMNGLLFARNNLVRLVTDDDSSMFVSEKMSSRTCGQWMRLLYEVGSCEYWNNEVHESHDVNSNVPVQLELPSFNSVSTNTDTQLMQDVTTNTVMEQVHTLSASTNTLTDVDRVDEMCVPLLPRQVGPASENLHELAVHFKQQPILRRMAQSSVEAVLSEDSPIITSESIRICNSQQCISPLVCGYCHRVGHGEGVCWRRLKLCLICGGCHHMRNCPRFVEMNISPDCVKCPLCSLKHLGKYCPQRLSPVLHCNWCGKNAHNETECWLRNGCCLVCGDSDHRVLACPDSKFNKKVLFPPWCAEQHLHGESYSPYI